MSLVKNALHHNTLGTNNFAAKFSYEKKSSELRSMMILTLKALRIPIIIT